MSKEANKYLLNATEILKRNETPLLFLAVLTLVPSLLGLLVRSGGEPPSASPAIPAFFYLLWFKSIAIDFTVFIAASLSLKHELLTSSEGSV
jgi:hypothetical protein